MSDTNRIDEARGYMLAARKALDHLEHDLDDLESRVGQGDRAREPALDRAARSALGVDLAVDELARATCWLTRGYRERVERRESMGRAQPGAVGGDAAGGQAAAARGRGGRAT